MPISISSSPSSKVGLPAAGVMQGVSAMPMRAAVGVDPAAQLGDLGQRLPSSAAAPQIFSASTVAPTPRRPAV